MKQLCFLKSVGLLQAELGGAWSDVSGIVGIRQTLERATAS